MKAFSSFQEAFKYFRGKAGKTFRNLSIELNECNGNICKIENGKLYPPSDKKIDEYIKAIKVPEENVQEFKDLANIARKEIPEDISGETTKLKSAFKRIRNSKSNS